MENPRTVYRCEVPDSGMTSTVQKISMGTCARQRSISKTVLVGRLLTNKKLIFNFSDIAEIDREACGAGLSERECDELKCCYDPRSTIQCYRPQVVCFYYQSPLSNFVDKPF